jgi:putative transposase
MRGSLRRKTSRGNLDAVSVFRTIPTKVGDYHVLASCVIPIRVEATMPFQPFDPGVEVHKHDQGRLPHWRQWGASYFITSRLADSMPVPLRKEWRARRDAWLASHGVSTPEALPEKLRHEFHREFTAAFHALLDAGHGECVLARPECAELIIARLVAGHTRAYQLDAWVIMPNHLHALVEPAKGSLLGDIVKSWKGGSAREINRVLGRTGSLWQKEPFDHIVRSEEQRDHFRRYIEENPMKAGLKSGFVVGRGAKVVTDFSRPKAVRRCEFRFAKSITQNLSVHSV